MRAKRNLAIRPVPISHREGGLPTDGFGVAREHDIVRLLKENPYSSGRGTPTEMTWIDRSIT
jgi:hypothetical protein